jgi:hypothetical protein
MRRRELLGAVATALPVGLAGCVGSVTPVGDGSTVPPVTPVPPPADSAPVDVELGERVASYDQSASTDLADLLPSFADGVEPHKFLVVNAADAARELRVAVWNGDRGVLLDTRTTFPPRGYLAGTLVDPDRYRLAVVAGDAAGRVRIDDFDCNARTTRVGVRSDRVRAVTAGTAAACGL